jgi:hypothetical protein
VARRGAAAVVVALVTPTASAAQVCGLTDVARSLLPADPPAAYGYDAPPPAPTPFEEAALRIRYARDEENWLSAWVSRCALGASPAPLAYAAWSEWLLDDDLSPLFVRTGLPLALHAEPSDASSTVAFAMEGDTLEPHEVAGEWMRVTLKQPSDYCRPGVASASHGGWVRWLTEDRGPRLWYFTRGC